MNVLTNQRGENQLNHANSIYCKLHQIQSEIKKVFKTKRNNFQNYNFFTEPQILDLVKPLLAKYQLGLFISDEVHENSSDISFTVGSNTDVAKAKGAAETYASKYFLSKFFLIPVQDISDPDYRSKVAEKKTNSERPLTSSEQTQVQTFLKKHG
ncbi:20174_t:CDS:2 [Racocetra fulgida]|uniref:20171_t:CDS:1 n=1 Tax=Racocetra fulgida TaxID=60492 RepID=A0A9N9HZM4_9GLOM|nr:20171_t:CDS:2 [Racocetra fulgida]CAG8713198.1 20174_t:CDS:2 [Racocetra fulgida]